MRRARTPPAQSRNGRRQRRFAPRHLVELAPEICSLDMGRMNMGGKVFVNAPAHLEAMAVAIRDASVTPEL